MNRLTFKYPVVNLVIGVILIVIAILGMFVFDWFSDFVNIVIALVIMYYSIARFLSERLKYRNKNALYILSVELAIAFLLSVLLVLREVNIYIAIGLVLYLRGLTYLLILQLLKLRTAFLNFIIAIVVLTLGAYVIFVQPDVETLVEYALFIFFIAYGILLVVFGIKYFKK